MRKELASADPELERIIRREEERQTYGAVLIPSRNHVSEAVLQAVGTVFNDDYAEGNPRDKDHPLGRFYHGTEGADELETLAMDRAKTLFGTPHANVQALSGSVANWAIHVATCKPGDPTMGLLLAHGGHLTQGHFASATGIFFTPHQYGVGADGRIDVDQFRRIARKEKPKLIWVGGTAYPFQYDCSEFTEVADEVGAILVCDCAHTAGLIAAGVHPSPVDHVDMITCTTQKTLRGNRGALIMVTKRGLLKDPKLGVKIDQGVFPRTIGGPHMHSIAGIAATLLEASQPKFKVYGQQIITNAQALAQALIREGFQLVGGGTENHLMLVNLDPVFGPGGGVFLSSALNAARMYANKNTYPGETSVPAYPSALRLGTPAVTTRGMGTKEMKMFAGWIKRVSDSVCDARLPEEKDARGAYVRNFTAGLKDNSVIRAVRAEVEALCVQFPIPALQ